MCRFRMFIMRLVELQFSSALVLEISHFATVVGTVGMGASSLASADKISAYIFGSGANISHLLL